MKRENKNFLYNVIYQLLIYVFPLVTIPYISRVLGVENIGIYSYTYSIVYCFMLIAMLGINNYGNRAVSRVRDDKEKLSKTFFSIYYLQLLLTILILGIYILYVILFSRQYKIIMCLQVLHLVSVAFDINWFYFGLEKFRLTITRNLVIKLLSTVLIFIFVKHENDLWLYTLIMAGSMLISQLYLVSRLHYYITFQFVKWKDILKNLNGCFVLFVPVLAYGVYRVMDKTMLGYFSVRELGFYENAEKIINLPIAVITALGTVMLPHMAYMLRNKKEKYKEKIYESMKLALLLAVTMSFGLLLVSSDAAIILFGKEFSSSGNIMKLLSVTIIASAWANVVRTQYLIPVGNDKVYLASTIGGAVINLIFNFIFIPRFGAYGACVGTVLAEVFVAVYQSVKTKAELDINKYLKLLVGYVSKGIFIMFVAYIATFYLHNIYIRFFSQIIIVVVLFILFYHQYIISEFFGRKKNK